MGKVSLMPLASVVCLLLTSIAQPVLSQSIAGGSDVPGYLEQQDNVHSGGTVVVCMALSDGLVLAADSRLTVMFSPNVAPSYKIASDSAAKLFDVGRIAIATYGEAFLVGRSLGSIVADFDKDKRDKDIDVEKVAKRFYAYIKPIYDQDVQQSKRSSDVGFIVAGYNKQGVGELFEIHMPSSPEPQLLVQKTHDNQGIIWRGQTDVIQRLIKGFDPGLGLLPTFSNLPPDSKKKAVDELNAMEYYIPYNYLPIQDGVDLALSLVQMTVDMQRFSFGTKSSPGSIPGVGGSVDVIIIDPYQLAWIKRKALAAK